MEFIKEEAVSLFGLIVVLALLFVGASMGHFFGGLGDKAFKKRKK